MLEIGAMKLYDVKELAELLQVHEKTIRRLIRTKELRGKKLAKKWFVAEEEIQVYFRLHSPVTNQQDRDRQQTST